ncbi:neuroglobin-like [Candoia aspera]|uniref:neuroglobin-like n=1 Tax=Candoia aspera TaxID=51853 RepID=UPI002FD7AB3C
MARTSWISLPSTAPRALFPAQQRPSNAQAHRQRDAKSFLADAGLFHLWIATHLPASVCVSERKAACAAAAPGLPRQMGCALSSPGDAADPTISEERRGPAPGLDEEGKDASHREVAEALPLSEAQKELIRESWKILHKNITRVGIIVFIRLFETHPECKDVFFLFRDVDDLQQLKMSKELRAHGLRVMSFIEKSVARLDQEDKLELLALELGKSHFQYKAPPNYYEYIGIQFIQAVQPILKEAWTPEVEKAWKGLFKYLVAVMRRGFFDEGKRPGASPSPSPQTAAVEATPDEV